jgi:hypothetical protein
MKHANRVACYLTFNIVTELRVFCESKQTNNASILVHIYRGHTVAYLVEALCYKPEGWGV